MNIQKKKELAIRTLKIGKDRIVFNQNRLEDIRKAITKQDIKDLVSDKAIFIKEIKGKKKIIKRKTRKKAGSRKKRVNTKKRDYIIITRKLRKYLANLKKRNSISRENSIKLRKDIRARNFKSLAQMKKHISEEIK